MKMVKQKKPNQVEHVNNLKIFNIINNIIMMRHFISRFTNTFTSMNYKYKFNIFNFTKPFLKDNDILKDNILVKSKKKISFNDQWENKDFYRKNEK